MAAETAPIRAKTRRVKDKALDIAEDILLNPGKHCKELYESTFLTVFKNAVPRTQLTFGILPPQCFSWKESPIRLSAR
jgi:hypothetical protein